MSDARTIVFFPVAQRVDEAGLGRRLTACDFEDDELRGAIDSLLADRGLHGRLAAMSAPIKGTSGTLRVADLIDQVAQGG